MKILQLPLAISVELGTDANPNYGGTCPTLEYFNMCATSVMETRNEVLVDIQTPILMVTEDTPLDQKQVNRLYHMVLDKHLSRSPNVNIATYVHNYAVCVEDDVVLEPFLAKLVETTLGRTNKQLANDILNNYKAFYAS